MQQRDEFLFVEKYRPRKIDDTILPYELKTVFKEFIANNNIPNLILSGGPGVGKTTVARAMLEEIHADYIIINGSLSGNIDTLRNEIMQFASSVSFQGGRKYVILDEADYLNANSTQPALRNFMEEYSKNCGFILTCNFKNRIISPLQSRCSTVDFTYTKADAPKLAGAFFKRVCNILDEEQVPYDKKVVAEIVQKFYPDWRRVLNELQKYSATGKIDTGILANATEESFGALTKLLKEKNFSGMRKWVAMNVDSDPTSLMRKLYDNSSDKLQPNSIPQLVLHIADYQYKSAFVSDQEVNLVAFLTQVMADCEFK